ncbi:MAG: putative ABC transport system permease protein [Cryomorphaceae bacterium]|jgi:putative ABC transport system permease protein
MRLARFTHTLELGFKSLMLRKLRSGLTILGIIFGVCSVITMLAVGNGAAFEAQERIKDLGSNNIIIESLKPPESDDKEQEDTLSFGIKRRDMNSIKQAIPKVAGIVPQRLMNENVLFRDKQKSAQIIGTQPGLTSVESIPILRGRFLCELDISQKNTVCILNKSLADELFNYLNPLEETLKIDNVYFTVIGVTSEQGDSEQSTASHRVYIPISTMQARYGDLIIKNASGSFSAEDIQLHKLILQMESPAAVLTAESQIINLLNRTHKKKDYKLTVPLQLLKQSEETQKMFNIVLGSIAAISLLVGGIGIMNIMLATVTERTREIGLRRALGAKKSDIITQFMVEAVLLSLIGGFIGVLLGIAMPQIISNFTSMNAIISPGSVVLAFIISALTGIIFGIYPAAKSAQLDPIEALRNE